MEKILTVNDVAAILQVKAITVREMFREKRLRGFKVGKSWRTTESMLQEDIDALARGESPAALPMPSAAPTSPAKPVPAATAPKQGAEPSPTPVQAASPKPAQAPKPSPAAERDTAPAPTPAPKPRPVSKPAAAPEKDSDDDTQQMLF